MPSPLKCRSSNPRHPAQWREEKGPGQAYTTAARLRYLWKAKNLSKGTGRLGRPLTPNTQLLIGGPLITRTPKLLQPDHFMGHRATTQNQPPGASALH